MKAMKTIAALFAVLVWGASAPAETIPNVTQIIHGKPVALKPNKAYLLIRTIVTEPRTFWNGNIIPGRYFIRIFTPEELAAIADKKTAGSVESNFVAVNSSDTYVTEAEKYMYLAEVTPGEYIVAGPDEPCMGSVKFVAKAGVITDLGHLNWALSARWPHDSGQLRGKHYTLSVVPYTDGMLLPAPLANLPREAADYHATTFQHYLRGIIDRLEPIPGVLDYTADGDVIDLKAAK